MITGCGWSFVGREQHEKRRGRGAGLEKRTWILGVERRLGVQNSGLMSPTRRMADTSAGEAMLASGWEEYDGRRLCNPTPLRPGCR